MREEAAFHLEPADLRRAADIAGRYGWSGLSLTVWLLARQLDGIPPERMLSLVEVVHAMSSTPWHDATEYGWSDGTPGAYTVLHMPREWWQTVGVEMVMVPPIPGKATYTLIARDLAADAVLPDGAPPSLPTF